MQKRFLATAIVAALTSTPAMADCVNGASMATSFEIIDNTTILLRGNTSILIKTFCYCFYPGIQIRVLKDSFCDYQSNVLLVGSTVVSAQEVKGL